MLSGVNSRRQVMASAVLGVTVSTCVSLILLDCPLSLSASWTSVATEEEEDETGGPTTMDVALPSALMSHSPPYSPFLFLVS